MAVRRSVGGRAVNEIDSNVEEGIAHLDATEAPLSTAGNARLEIDAARTTFVNARDLAEQNGHPDSIDVIDRLIEYPDSYGALLDELETACEAGDTGHPGGA